MRSLEEFLYGSINPTDYDTSFCREYKKLLTLICRNEKTPSNYDKQTKGTAQEIYRLRAVILDYHGLLNFPKQVMLGTRIILEVLEK